MVTVLKNLKSGIMKVKSIFILVIATFLINSCEGLFPCLEGNGDHTTEERGVANFTGIYNATDFDIEIIYDTETRLIVEADENLQQYIRTYVENGDLIIETDQNRCLSSVNIIKVTVYCPQIETIVLSGSGDIEVYDFKPQYLNITLSGSGDIDLNQISVSNSIEVNLPGSGDVRLDGKASEAYYYLSGSGDINGENMTCSYAKVVLSGSGNVDVFAYDNIDITLSGSGNIYVYGDPVIKDRISGSGKVILR